ncbi:MAG: NADH-quinone oxidoreductase subunit NuoE [Chloroflexota bacterium]
MREELAEILTRYEGQRGAIIPILQSAQEKLGYISEPVIREIAKSIRITANEIFGILTFYAQFRTTPSGKIVVRVCRGTACHVKGAAKVLEEVESMLGIKAGESTADLEYTLETVACIGACALAPTIVIGKDTYGQMTAKKVAEVFRSRGKD